MTAFHITLIIVFIILAIGGILLNLNGWPCGYYEWSDFIMTFFYLSFITIVFASIIFLFVIFLHSVDWHAVWHMFFHYKII